MSGAIDIKPAFQAEKVSAGYFRMIMHIEEDVRKVGPNGDKSIITRKLVPKREEFAEGYMIYFPQGHSIFVAADDIEQLQRIGVLGPPKLVDMNSGEEVPNNVNLSPKDIVERSNSKRGRPSQGGMTALLQGEIE